MQQVGTLLVLSATQTMSSVWHPSCRLVWLSYSSNIAAYLNSDIVGNVTCTITPRWLNVNVTYVRDGFVTLEPMTQLPDISLTSSGLIQYVISALQVHLNRAQALEGNDLVNTIESLLFPGRFDSPQIDEFYRKNMVSMHYTRASPNHWPHA